MKIHPKSYSLGYVRGCSDERDDHRVAAFGALRRLAEHARMLEGLADSDYTSPRSRVELKIEAMAIRRAIRYALQSAKR